MTTEQILGKIKDEHGKSALRDGQSLSGLFQDYSHNQLQPQANALKVFVSCQGNTRILNLQNATVQKQQTEYHRLVQEMTTQHNMREETAAEVCSAFWRVVIGTEPPIAKPASVPVSVPVSTSESKETAVQYIKASDSAATLKSEQNPDQQASISDNHPIQKSSTSRKQKAKLEIPRKKGNKYTFGVLMVGVFVVWAISMLLVGVSCVGLMDIDEASSIAAPHFLLALLVLVESVVMLYRFEWIEKHLRITIILEIILFVPVLSVSISYANAVDTGLAAFMAIVAVLWQIFTIVLQLLMMKESQLSGSSF